ncbi:MAG: PEP-CTERM sorting domain-containing protein, partial [bacterium]|nr:PEP-CTERM sorting domain-containing protein [bacterium]
CSEISNPAQTDTDSDTVGDLCDVCPGGDDTVDSDNDTVPDACDICAPAPGSTLVRVTMDGTVSYSPPELAGTLDTNDPFSLDLVIDGATPNEVAAPDYQGSDVGYLETFLVVGVSGPVDLITVDDATNVWALTGAIDLQALLGVSFPVTSTITSPLNSGIVPDWSAATGGSGTVDVYPMSLELVTFDLTSVVSNPEPNPSDDTVDTDSDGTPDDCDDYPYWGSDSNLSFDDAYSDNGHASDPASYYTASHGVTISGTYFGIVDGVSNGDTGVWALDGTNGPAVLGSDSGLSSLPTFSFDSTQGEVSLDVGISGGATDTITVTSFLGGSPADTDVVPITDDNNGSGTWVTIQSQGPLDEVRVTTTSGTDFGIDNVTFVPEPGTVVGLLFGAGALAAAARRRDRR